MTKQIGQHIKRVEHAKLAADRQRMNERSTSGDDDHNRGQDLEKHHQISKSQKDDMNIYSYVYAHRGDPAFNISLCVPQTDPGDNI